EEEGEGGGGGRRGEGGGLCAGGGGHRHSAAHQFRRHVRQEVVATARPSELNRNILAFDKAALDQTAAECGKQVRGILRRPCAHEPDHRLRWLLRARCQWPRRHRPAEKRNELAPLHVEHGGLPPLRAISAARPVRSVFSTSNLPQSGQASPWGSPESS